MWRVRNATVSVAQKQVQPLTPTAQLFYSGNMIGGTFSGAQDTFSDMNQDMHPGELITAKWTGGDPGDTATLSVFGTQEIP
jgi:hypothetical protein